MYVCIYMKVYCHTKRIECLYIKSQLKSIQVMFFIYSNNFYCVFDAQ